MYSQISSAKREAIVIRIVKISNTLDSTAQLNLLMNHFQQLKCTSSSSSLDECVYEGLDLISLSQDSLSYNSA